LVNEVPTLAGHFGFTVDDLETNRRGELTEAQSVHLQQAIKVSLASILVPWLILFGAVMAVVPNSFEVVRLHVSVFFVFLSLLFLSYSGYVIIRYRKDLQAIKRRKIKAIEGIASITSVRSTNIGNRIFYLLIEEKRFVILEEESRLISRGRRYRVYYSDLMWSSRLMSLEQVEP
jgi:hypothetical protein